MSQSSEPEITIISSLEAVRLRHNMFIEATDQRGLHQLITYTVDSLLWHYRFLKQPLAAITVRLERDNSATITSEVSRPSESFLERSAQQMRKDIGNLYTGPIQIFVVSALCDRLSMTIHEQENQWRSLVSERGVVQSEEVVANSPCRGCDIQIRLWPDFTILDPGNFDYERTREVLQPIATRNADVAITVVEHAG